jgi:omega-6 fatty acid desaturase (delta-12 desaturase)
MPQAAERHALPQTAPATALERNDDLAFPDRRSLPQALAILAVHFGLYFGTLAGAVAPLPVVLNVACAMANGVLIALLFIIGHDGAHGGFVPGRKLNLWIARVAFIPCVHAVSLWCTIHNKLHHGYTNLKGYDGVWTPMSKAEYDRCSAPRRFLERVYRGPFGPLVYYYVEFWPQRTLLPLAPEVRKTWRLHLPDSAFTLAGLALTLVGIAALGQWLTPARPLWQIMLVGWVLPYAVWNYLMAFTTYLNHTHPSIAWFDDEAKWRRHRPNLVDTANVLMPFPLKLIPLYDDVMVHTVHHVQTNVPVYALPEAQADLNARVGEQLEYKLSLREYFRILRICKLFDFERMCWTGFNGVPTA